MVFPVSRDRKFFWLSWLVSALAALALCAEVLVPSARAEDPPVDPPSPVQAPASTEDVDFPSAMIQAKATGKKVEVTGERSDSSTTWVNPDGTGELSTPRRFARRSRGRSMSEAIISSMPERVSLESVEGNNASD